MGKVEAKHEENANQAQSKKRGTTQANSQRDENTPPKSEIYEKYILDLLMP